MTYIKIFLFTLVFTGSMLAQSGLRITPGEINFPDEFHRLKNVYFINEGNQPINIDSIYYKKNLYYIRFNIPWQYPFTLNPADTLLMDCILSKYFLVENEDTNDTMFVYLENNQSIKIPITINFYNPKVYPGKISGSVFSGTNTVDGATIYFYKDGKFLIDSASTDMSGYYEGWLPEGLYTVAARKTEHYLSFFNDQPSPLNPVYVNINRGNASVVNLNLKPESVTGYSISGKIFDGTNFGILKRAIVITRPGVHNADKRNGETVAPDTNIYSSVVNSNGEYHISVPSSGYYSVQAFCEYYLPGYYNQSGTSLFWQQADSVYVHSDIVDKDIFVTRDSSFGAGIIKGKVFMASQSDSQITNVIILVQTVQNNSFISYTNAEANGNFQITNLPYGNYKLIAQKIGLEDASSIIISIDSTNNIRENVRINLVTSISGKDKPEKFFLGQNYPNPFNPATTLDFQIADFAYVTLKVFDILGNEIATLVNEYKPAGNYKINFNANGLSSGIYFYQLKAGENIQTKKMTYLK